MMDWGELIADAVPRSRAAFESVCLDCGGKIYEGDVIVKIDGDWVCEDCQ